VTLLLAAVTLFGRRVTLFAADVTLRVTRSVVA
jgi:hypothetical protein